MFSFFISPFGFLSGRVFWFISAKLILPTTFMSSSFWVVFIGSCSGFLYSIVGFSWTIIFSGSLGFSCVGVTFSGLLISIFPIIFGPPDFATTILVISSVFEVVLDFIVISFSSAISSLDSMICLGFSRFSVLFLPIPMVISLDSFFKSLSFWYSFKRMSYISGNSFVFGVDSTTCPLSLSKSTIVEIPTLNSFAAWINLIPLLAISNYYN